jgi:signal transduction histidine kinase
VYLAVIGVFVFRSVNRVADTTERVERTHLILRTLEQVLSIVNGAETGVRGFVNTGDARHLDAYRGAESDIAASLNSLDSMTTGDSAQRARLQQLAPLVARRFSILHETTALRDSGGFAEAAAATKTGRGTLVMDSIRNVVDAMATHETTRLRDRSAQEQRGLRRATSLIAVSFLAAVSLGLLAAVVVSQDVDRRLRAEAEARRAKEIAEAASRAKSEFLAMMSHELRTPLNSVIGFSNVLLKNRAGNLTDKDLVYAQRIKAGGQQLLSLIAEVLDLSKVEAGRMRLERAPVELGALVADTVASFEGQTRGRPLSLEAEIPDGLTPIMTDPSKLLQVLTNLIGNAIKFTERGRVVARVVADAASRRPVRIEVTDTGIGIPPERQAAIFDAFEQADTSTARRYGGTGLGLAVSKSLCDLMGYRLEVRSTVGVGSVFTVILVPGSGR